MQTFRKGESFIDSWNCKTLTVIKQTLFLLYKYMIIDYAEYQSVTRLRLK
jgi:hypothetical protein